MDARTARAKRTWVSLGSLAALTLGFLLGTWGHGSGTSYTLDVAALLSPIGKVWVNALRMVVVPLVVAQLVYTLVTAGGSKAMGRITSSSFLVFGGLLILGAAFTI